jgi:hypothetical protein
MKLAAVAVAAFVVVGGRSSAAWAQGGLEDSLTEKPAAPAAAPSANGGDLMCGPAEHGTITLDGLTDDWTDVQGVDVGKGSPDLSFTVKCNTEGGKIFLLVDVRDSYFVRTKQGHPGEDHLEFTLGGHRFTVYPGNARDIPTKVSLPSVKAQSALQEKGWAVELMLSPAAVGARSGSPIAYKIVAADSDSKASLKTEKTLEASGAIVFAEADATLNAFLGDRGLKRSDVWLDKPLATGKKSAERLVFAGKFMASIGDGFVYAELPVASRGDVKEVKIVDLAGDGRQAVVLRWVERGNGGSRELLGAFRPSDSGFERKFAAEVAKTIPGGRVEDKVAFVKRGAATDIVITPGPSSVSQDKWNEFPADDVVPIMLPWGSDKRARFVFNGDEYKRAQ